MLMGLLFALLAILCGVAVSRAARAPLSLAPLTGLACIASLTTAATAIGIPPVLQTASTVCLGGVGLALLVKERTRLQAVARQERLIPVLLAAAVMLPTLMLGVAFAGLEAPVSTHDGAFHVEAIDGLRRGVAPHTWYPIGFHTSVAAMLGLTPWLDTARGTFEAALGLATLGPLAVFALGLALGLPGRVSAVGSVILGITWTYPYDYHLWGGWPQGMSILLTIGLLVTALRWIERPAPALALLTGLFAGAIVMTHGTEVYTSVVGLVVIALALHRKIAISRLLKHTPLALGVALLVSAPYLPTLLGWAGSGGATGAGQEIIDYTAANPEIEGHGDWLQFIVGGSGAASLIDLPVRTALIALGFRMRRGGLAAAFWATFMVILLLVDFTSFSVVQRVFVMTFPWLVDHRPRQVAVVFGSLLAAGGLWICLGHMARLRDRISAHPQAWRRLAVAGSLIVFFFAEGSGVSIYKRLVGGIAEQNVYWGDEAAAMSWLHQHAAPGDILANDLAADAGIWAPYKASVPILLPRSGAGMQSEQRSQILEKVLFLDSYPALANEACTMGVRYLFHGAAPQIVDERLFPDKAALESAPDLEEVFSSGDAAVFRVNLSCNQSQ